MILKTKGKVLFDKAVFNLQIIKREEVSIDEQDIQNPLNDYPPR